MISERDDLAVMSAILETLPNFAAWFTTWPKARAEFEHLIAEYRQRYPQGDAYRLELMLETTDKTMYELHHRLAWLEQQVRAGAESEN
jgi:hypothetical protein